jgi:hypothetical protein
MTKDDIAGISTKLYALLKPLDSPMRKRAIRAALTMLGEEDADSGLDDLGKKREDRRDGGDHVNLPTRARSWMKSEKVTAEELGHVFDLENGAEIIASHAPGKNKKEQTINAYVLTGISQLLKAGDTKFDDASGRAAATSLGCFDRANHATTMKKKGNVLSGSKVGWSLTGPGLKSGAALIKELAQERVSTPPSYSRQYQRVCAIRCLKPIERLRPISRSIGGSRPN